MASGKWAVNSDHLKLKFPRQRAHSPVASPYPRHGEIWGGSRPVRGGQAGPPTMSCRLPGQL